MTGWVRLLAAVLLAANLLTACNAPRESNAGNAVKTGNGLRIVTLSPHLAELVFAVGAGDLLVGVSAYTDAPEAAASLPVIGDAFNIDQERLTLLAPDLLLAWDTGTPAHVIDELRDRGFRVEVVTTTSLTDIPLALLQIGELTGRNGAAPAAAFKDGLDRIAGEYADAPLIDVFYQVDARPLYTINGAHFLSEAIELCGGANIFSDLDGLAPLVSVEAVLERDPDVILASTDAGSAAFDEWDRWTELTANRLGNRFLMPADDIGRPTPRLLNGVTAVCSALEKARENRQAEQHD